VIRPFATVACLVILALGSAPSAEPIVTTSGADTAASVMGDAAMTGTPPGSAVRAGPRTPEGRAGKPVNQPEQADPPPVEVRPARTVIASWYGPGFYSNRTACGQTFTPEIVGAAHRSLPCGTLVTLRYRGVTVTIPVIDRGPGCTFYTCDDPPPHLAGREFDLSSAARAFLGCSDLCRVEWLE